MNGCSGGVFYGVVGRVGGGLGVVGVFCVCMRVVVYSRDVISSIGLNKGVFMWLRRVEEGGC